MKMTHSLMFYSQVFLEEVILLIYNCGTWYAYFK